jgi:hypothetical protein
MVPTQRRHEEVHMADLHHHHDTGTTVVREDVDHEGPATALIVLLILAFVGFLIWLFAFSGVVFNRNSGGSTVPTQNNNTTVQTTENPTTPNTGGSTAPAAS